MLSQNERAVLLKLLNRTASKQRLAREFGISESFLWHSGRMPEPVAILSKAAIYDIEEVQAAYKNTPAKRVWTPRELLILNQMRAEGKSFMRIAAKLGRTYQSVKNRVEYERRKNHESKQSDQRGTSLYG